MSAETIWNWEAQSFEKTKNLSDIDMSWIEQNYVKIQEIKSMELVDNEDNKVTIPSDLQDFFWEEIENDIEWKVLSVKNSLYDSLWIDRNVENINRDEVKFFKWLVDWFSWNIEAIEELYDKWIDSLVKSIKSLDSLEKIKDFVIQLWEDVLESLKWIWEPYETWMIIWWLWLWPLKSIKVLEKVDKIDWKDNDK